MRFNDQQKYLFIAAPLAVLLTIYAFYDHPFSRGWHFNEEVLLIINFFLLLYFFYTNVGGAVGDFLQNRRLVIREEAYRLLETYRNNALKLKRAYTSKRDLEELLYVSFISVYKPSLELKRNVEPFLLSSVLNRWTLLQLSLLYKEEVNAIRANYIRKYLLLRNALPTALQSELLLDGTNSEESNIEPILSEL